MEDTLKIKGFVSMEAHKLPKGLLYIARLLNFFSNSMMTSFVRKYGVLQWSDNVTNTIVNAGKAQLALLAGDASATPFTYLELGTSATAVATSQTALQAAITDSGLARVAATVSRVTTTQTNDTLQLTYTWTATGSKTVEEVGVFNASSSGTMLGRALTSTKALVNTDIFTITYKVQFT